MCPNSFGTTGATSTSRAKIIITSTTTNGVTAITVDVAKVAAYAQALQNGARQLAGLGIASAGFNASMLLAANVIATDAQAFSDAAGGKLVLTYDGTSIPAGLASIFADGQKILSGGTAALPQTAIIGTVAAIFQAVQTVVGLIETFLPIALAATPRPMTEAAALAVLGVKLP